MGTGLLFRVIEVLKLREFPGSPVVRTPSSHCCGPDSVPGQGTKIPRAVQCGQGKKRRRKKNTLLSLMLSFVAPLPLPSPSYQNSQNDDWLATISKLPLAPPPSVDCYSQAQFP